MNPAFEKIVGPLVQAPDDRGPLTGIEIGAQFDPTETGRETVLRNLNAAFLIVLCGKAHPFHNHAVRYLKAWHGRESTNAVRIFFSEGLSRVETELDACFKRRGRLYENLSRLCRRIETGLVSPRDPMTREMYWSLFFPEGVSIFENREKEIAALREKRSVRLTRLNHDPIRNPARQILFTGNVLLTTPPPSVDPERLQLSQGLKKHLLHAIGEPQRYYYDHPIQIGVDHGANEVVYGLENLDRAVAFEKARGTVARDQRVTCILSVSVTHEALHDVAKSYLRETLGKMNGIRHLRVYVFTESDTNRMVDEVMDPCAKHYLGSEARDRLRSIIGVDGEYGRHYSFLKAITAFWQVFADPGIRASFKIDLDQVFPQEALVKHTGLSAFEHFSTPLWGAKGVDQAGRPVDLGMIAGALVNERDLPSSLFTPDVPFPPERVEADEWVFFSPLPQALSTEAEMMTRYRDDPLNGRERCLQRVHVTGGTCGVLVDRLRKYRPFTPGFIGRAEDQAYLLSVLFDESDENLRYVHKDGLIMRHDKESFAAEAIKQAHLSKVIGDYERILRFTGYARALPWGLDKIKEVLDPFTGCFISHMPMTLVHLRFALKAASFFQQGRPKTGRNFLEMGSARLRRTIKAFSEKPDPLEIRYREEKEAWHVYYDALEGVERALSDGDLFALELRVRAKKLMKACEIEF